MHCVLLMYGSESRNLSQDEHMELHKAYVAYTEAMHSEGVLRGNHGFRPSSEAKSVGGGKVHDGPADDGPLHLKGYYLIDVADMHSAIEWAKRCPGAKHDTIEIRPVWE